jgi:hypothetical protein
MLMVKLRLTAGLTAARRAAKTVRWRNMVCCEGVEDVKSWVSRGGLRLFEAREESES